MCRKKIFRKKVSKNNLFFSPDFDKAYDLGQKKIFINILQNIKIELGQGVVG